jgi:hypothetical protein
VAGNIYQVAARCGLNDGLTLLANVIAIVRLVTWVVVRNADNITPAAFSCGSGFWGVG